MRLGFGEILVILVVALVVFGEALGKGIRNVKRASDHPDDEDVGPGKAEQAQMNQASAGTTRSPAAVDRTGSEVR
jgi:Sec-independent protein translocase protein TatA